MPAVSKRPNAVLRVIMRRCHHPVLKSGEQRRMGGVIRLYLAEWAPSLRLIRPQAAPVSMPCLP